MVSATSWSQVNDRIKLLYNWTDTTLTPSTLYANSYNEVWGFVINSREYGVIGSSRGTHFFDVTDTANISMVAFVQEADTGAVIVHRDYHDYKGYLYAVSDEGNSTLQIIDLQYLPDSVVVVYDTSSLFSRSHNIFIDTAKQKLYVCSPKPGNMMEVYSLTDPLTPVLIDTISIPQLPGSVHDVYVRNDTAFCNVGLSGLYVMDFSVAGSPQLLGSLTTYTDQYYNHSGWLHPTKDIYVFADELQGMRMKLCDVSDLSDIKELSLVSSGVVPDSSYPHNPIIKGDILYVAHYHDGLWLFDLSDSSNPQPLGFYDTYSPSDHVSFRGAWGVYPFLPSGIILVSDMRYGFFVFDASEAENAVSIRNNGKVKNYGLTIYPQPFTKNFQLVFDGLKPQNITINLININGQVVYTEKQYIDTRNVSLTITPTDKIANGLYFLKITGEIDNFTSKVIKINGN